jgi:hypothetical protein
MEIAPVKIAVVCPRATEGSGTAFTRGGLVAGFVASTAIEKGEINHHR